MKPIPFFFAFLFSSSILLNSSCTNSDSKKTTKTDTKELNSENTTAVTSDSRSLPQYVSCKIDGHPYLATYVYNAMSLPSRQDFTTREDQQEINGETKISEMEFSFYTLQKKQEGTLTSNKDFRAAGYTMFPEGGKLVRVNFETREGGQLNLTSYKDGILEGTFSFEDNSNPAHTVKVTEGVFKMKQEGKTNMQIDKNGDVNMDSLLKSINK